MTPQEEAERFFALRKKGYQDGDEGRTEEEEREYERLYERRRSAVMAMRPLPRCCEAAQKYPAVTFTVDFEDPEGDDVDEANFLAKGSWYIDVDDAFRRERSREDRDYYSKPWPEPKFCPYCGKGLPKMRLKNPVPVTVCRILDGGYYCSTCHERANECVCDPPSSAFEPEPEGG